MAELNRARRNSAEPRVRYFAAILFLWVAAPLLLTAQLLRAAADADQARLRDLSLEQLGNVEVTTVTKSAKQASRTAAAIYVLTGEDIRRSGATSLPELLRLVPGVEVARTDSSTWSVGIRGFGNDFSRSVLVLIDGRSVYTPLFAGVNWKLQNLLLEDVDRIEVIRGPGGTIWGSNAVNGVINIITRNSKDTLGEFAFLGGGNIDQVNGGFRYGGGAGRNVSYRVYGMAFDRGTEFHSDRDNFDDWQLGQGGFRMDWETRSRDSFTLQGDIYEGRIGQRQTIASYSPPASNNVNSIQEVSGGNVLGRWRRNLSGGSDIQIQAYYDRTYRFGSQIGETRNTFDLDFIHHFTFFPRQDVTWGGGARWSPSDVIQTVATVDFLPHHQSDDLYSTFAQDEVALVSGKLWLTVGSKFEHNIYTGWEFQPNVRLLYTPSSRETLWASATRAVRTPSRLDTDLQLTGLIATNPLPVFLRLTGNPDFRSETLVGYEAGYRSLLTENVSFDAAAFYNNYDHLQSLELGSLFVESTPAPLHAVYPVVSRNGVEGRTSGVEIAANWKPVNWWRLEGSYSYLHMGLKTKPASVDTTTVNSLEGSSPNHQAVFQSLFDLGRNLDVSLAVRYVSALPAQHVDAYETVDARMAWRPVRHIEFSIAGRNLAQPSHAEFGGDPGPLIGIRRSIYAALAFRR
jgi:iron complex outermembrane receptor protein